MPPAVNVSKMVQRALGDLRKEKMRIERQIGALESVFAVMNGRSTPAAPAARRRSRMSPAARKAVARRMKAYWAGRRKAAAKS